MVINAFKLKMYVHIISISTEEQLMMTEEHIYWGVALSMDVHCQKNQI
jgi:hypothetical protein